MDYKPTYNLRGTTLHFPIFLGVCSGHVTVFFFWLLDIPVVRIIPIKHHSCPWNIIHVHETSFMSMKHHHCIKPSYHNFPKKKHLESSRYRKHTDFTNKYYTQFPCFFFSTSKTHHQATTVPARLPNHWFWFQLHLGIRKNLRWIVNKLMAIHINMVYSM